MPPIPPTHRYPAGTEQAFRVVARLRHAEPIFRSEDFARHLVERVAWLATPPRASVEPSRAGGWKGARTDVPLVGQEELGDTILRSSLWATAGAVTLGPLGGALAGYFASRPRETSPRAPQWTVGLQGVVAVRESVSHEDLLRAVARAFADSVTWTGQRDATPAGRNPPTHGGDLLQRLLSGQTDPTGVYTDAQVVVTQLEAPPRPSSPSVPSRPTGEGSSGLSLPRKALLAGGTTLLLLAGLGALRR